MFTARAMWWSLPERIGRRTLELCVMMLYKLRRCSVMSPRCVSRLVSGIIIQPNVRKERIGKTI
jgi:hypothetical protein